MKPLRVGFLGFDGVMALEVVGPIDAFTTALLEESADAFRRAFERRFGVQPSSYHKHFSFEMRASNQGDIHEPI